jgi:hypothetical protein
VALRRLMSSLHDAPRGTRARSSTGLTSIGSGWRARLLVVFALSLVATTAHAAQYCDWVRGLRTQSCLSRYDCTAEAGALTRLSTAACACMRDRTPEARGDEQLMELARRVRSFACCYGIAIAGAPEAACRTRPN